jgi:hypothetical protein
MRLRPTTGEATRRATLALAIAALVLGFATLAVYAARAHHGRRPAKAKLALAGNLRKALRPGASQPIDVVLSNRNRFAVSVIKLRVTVSVRPRRRGAKCSARRDFAITQLNRRAYPIRLPARARRRSLSRLRVRHRLLPRITMRDLRHTNQNDCQRASLRLRYSVRVRKAAKPRRRHR